MSTTSAITGLCSHLISTAPVQLRRLESNASQIDNLTFSCHDRAGPHIVGLGRELVHEIVVVRRVVMEQAEVLDLSFVRQAHAAHPRRMAPPRLGRYFVLGER